MGFKEKGFEVLHIHLLTYCMNDNDEMKPTKKDKTCYKKSTGRLVHYQILSARSRKHMHTSVSDVISNEVMEESVP